jgi:predicted transposase/invertase (TIGR01784 family)
MRTLLDKVDGAVKNCREKGQIDEQDALDIIRDLDRLYAELYGGYEEFVEDENMKEKFIRYSTQIMEAAKREGKLEGKLEVAKNLLAFGVSPEKVAQATELPLRQIKALLKTLKIGQPA